MPSRQEGGITINSFIKLEGDKRERVINDSTVKRIIKRLDNLGCTVVIGNEGISIRCDEVEEWKKRIIEANIATLRGKIRKRVV